MQKINQVYLKERIKNNFIIVAKLETNQREKQEKYGCKKDGIHSY